MIQEFVINSKLPDFNSLRKAASTFYSAFSTKYSHMTKQTISLIRSEIMVQNIQPMRSVFLNIKWFEKNKRRDPDNIAVSIKFILDAMQKEGVIKNDGWKEVDGWKNTFLVDKEYHVDITLIGKRKDAQS